MDNQLGFLLIAICLTIPQFKAVGGNDNNSLPVKGKVYSYQARTNSPKNTYTDPGLTTANANPPAALNNPVNAQQFGAKGDGVTDDTTALNATAAACPLGGVIYLPPGTYKTTGWLISKSLSLVADTPILYGTGSPGATLKAAGRQAYVLKFAGTYGAGDGNAFLHPYLRNINIDGKNQTISDAAFIMEFCHLARIEGCSFQHVQGHGIRLRTVWELRMRDFFIANCGTPDTGSAFYIDGPSPYDAIKHCSNLAITGGTWSSNRGRWIEASPLAAIDGVWIEDNKFELDNCSQPNGSPANVLHFGSASRTMVLNNTFAGFGASGGNYANLIYLGGDPSDPAMRGSPTNRVSGNRGYAYNPSSGAVNGLYLDTYTPTCEENDNTFVSSYGETCPNVNVSQYPQLINLCWRNQSTSFFPNAPLPDREQPGFVSIHKVSRGAYAKPFVPDKDCVNNSQTVLRVPEANRVNADICAQFDLSRWIGYNAKNLQVRMRAKLGATGSDTVSVNPVSPAWNPVNITVNSTSWAWYTFMVPIANLSAANHMMDVYFWEGKVPLEVDGFEFTAP